MKRVIIASTKFDLNDEDTQYDIAQYAKKYVLDAVSNKVNKRRKKNLRQFYVDDLSWSADSIHFDVYEEDDGPGTFIADFSCPLNFYDEPSESMEDVKYLIDEQTHEFLYEIR